MALFQDENGIFKLLSDGRVLRINKRIFTVILTVSDSREDPCWTDGW
jgi:hypothetical protein